MIQAIYENGVFRPLEKVELPENCRVQFEPRLIDQTSLTDIYEVLGRRYTTGESDIAEQHNEHQP